MILAFGGLRLRIHKEEQQRFAKIMSTCLLVFNAAILGHFYAAYYFESDSTDDSYGAATTSEAMILWGTEFVCIIIGLLAFNLGEWYQGFHYFKCATEMEMMFKKGSQEELKRLKQRNERVNFGVKFVNIFAITAFAVITIVNQVIR